MTLTMWIDSPSGDDDKWTISFDVRNDVPCESNHDFMKFLRAWTGDTLWFYERDGVAFDPEWSCFFAYAPTQERANDLAGFLTERVQDFYIQHLPPLEVSIITS